MIPSIERDRSVEVLLNTLEVERYVRKPLLLSVLDELDRADGLAAARELAHAMLTNLEAGRDEEFSRCIARLRELVIPSHAA